MLELATIQVSLLKDSGTHVFKPQKGDLSQAFA